MEGTRILEQSVRGKRHVVRTINAWEGVNDIDTSESFSMSMSCVMATRRLFVFSQAGGKGFLRLPTLIHLRVRHAVLYDVALLSTIPPPPGDQS